MAFYIKRNSKKPMIYIFKSWSTENHFVITAFKMLSNRKWILSQRLNNNLVHYLLVQATYVGVKI